MTSGPNISWQIEGEKVGTVADFIFLGSKITVDSDYSHEIKRHLLLGRKTMTNVRQHIQKQRCYFADKGPYSQSYGFSCSHTRFESWTIKKAECQRTDNFGLWCWRRLLRVTWTPRRPNQSILKEIIPEYSHASKVMLKILQARLQQDGTVNSLMFKLVLEKGEEPEIKLPTSAGSWKKQESSRKTSISALLTMPKPLTVWITINCGKF